MWFNNALIYEYELEKSSDLAAALSDEMLKACPPHARVAYGWLPAIADQMVHEVTGSSLICLGKEERILPRGVVIRMAEERIAELEAHRGQPVKRSERAQLMEEMEFELLPKSFCLQKKMHALMDANTGRLIVNSGSPNQASQLTGLLRKSVPGLKIKPLTYSDNLAIRFTHWITTPGSIPAAFQLASDCLLFSLDNEKKQFNCKGCDLPAEEILALLAKGLAAAEVSMIWNDRIQFTLTQNLTLKRLKCLDYLTEEFNEVRENGEELEQQDAALALLAGELRALTDDLFQALNESGKAPVSQPVREMEYSH